MNREFVYGHVRALPDNVDETRTIEFIISNETRDRHGTVIPVKGWKLDNYNRNPIVGYQHNVYGDMFGGSNPDEVIGKSSVFVEGGNLIGRVTFEPPELNPLAEKIFQKVKFGTLSTASVGFAPIGETKWGKGDEGKNGKNPTQYYQEQELVEWSIVNIPSNPSATKREFAEQNERMLCHIEKALDGKFNRDEIMKMTVKGLMNVLSGEGVEQDDTERTISEGVDLEGYTKRTRHYQWMRGVLSLHNNFDTPIKIGEEEEKERQKRLKIYHLRMKMEANRYENKNQ